jgi:hypothetical protein
MKSILWIIIIFLLSILLLQRECTPTHSVSSPPVYIYDTIYDTLIIQPKAYVPKPVYRDTGSTKWRYHEIDTLKILQNYFSRQLYRDTIVNDSNALIVLNDTVSRNQIISRLPQITLYPQTIYRTQYLVIPQKSSLHIGFSVGKNPSQFSLASSVMFQSKKGNIYFASYDFISHDVYLGMSWKITFKRQTIH